MVVVVKEPEAIEYIRQSPVQNTEMIERILCRKLGLVPRQFQVQNRGNEKTVGLKTAIPIKIIDKRLVSYIGRRKEKNGVMQRRTVELAILEHKKKYGAYQND